MLVRAFEDVIDQREDRVTVEGEVLKNIVGTRAHLNIHVGRAEYKFAPVAPGLRLRKDIADITREESNSGVALTTSVTTETFFEFQLCRVKKQIACYYSNGPLVHALDKLSCILITHRIEGPGHQVKVQEYGRHQDGVRFLFVGLDYH